MQFVKINIFLIILISILFNGCSDKKVDSINLTGASGNGNSESNLGPTDTIAPTVVLTAPLNFAIITTNTTISANAIDDVQISKVEFYRDNILIGSDDTSPYSFLMNVNASMNGTYQITAKAYDSSNNSSISSPNTLTINVPIIDTTPPTVTLTTPTNNSIITGTTTLIADAFDNISVTKVEFYVDSNLIGTDTTVTGASSFSFSWAPTPTLNGPHVLKAKAYDAANNSIFSNNINVTLNMPTADSTPPSVSLITPVNGATLTTAPTSITAIATDNVAISKVEFYLGTTFLGQALSSPYTLNYSFIAAQNGSKTITAKAYDTSNYTATSASTVTINIPDVTFPTVSLTTPTNGTNITGSTILTAAASDDVGITKVEFYDGATLLSPAVTTAPYTKTWTPNISQNGPHTLTAKAYDAVNHITTSSPISVTVNIPDTTPPTVSLAATPTTVTAANTAITFTATATDNVAINKVEFYKAGVLVGTDTTPPYNYSWTPTLADNGSNSFTAKAYDTATPTNNTATSTVVTVTVNIPDTVPPSIVINSPLNGATITSATMITATASDNAGISKVIFYNSTNVLCTVLAPGPYQCNFNPTNNGSKTLTAVAFDTATPTANQTTSAAVVITAAIPPIAPSNLVTSSLAVNSISLTWTDNSTNESNFELQSATVADFSTVLGTTTIAANTTSATISSLNPATTYYFRIRSTNAGTGSTWSTTSIGTTLPPLPVNSSGDAQHTCIIKNNQLKCWGLNNYGQLGINSTVNQSVPQVVTLNGTPTSVTVGGYHTCAIVNLSGVKSVYCWGLNSHGQIGNGTTSATGVLTPTLVTLSGTNPVPNVIAAGLYHTCVIATVSGADKLQCWGYNQYGQIGDNTTTNKLVPTNITLTGTPKNMGGGSAHTCAIVTVSGVDKLFCWGINNFGRLGLGIDDGVLYTLPKEIAAPGGPIKKLAVGRDHTCIIVTVGTVDTVKCFGYNINGQLGVGNTTYQISSQAVNLSGTPLNLFLGYYFSCAISAVSGVNKYFCWGQNNYAQLSLPTTTTMLLSPSTTPVTLSYAPTQAFTGQYHTCIYSNASPNTIQCWGSNTYGQLGNGTTSTTGVQTPTTITP